jgi:DHA2 family multidrug resistance protein
MELLDTSIVNVSLPHIGGSLGASVNEATWVLTSYLVANAIVVPLGGWLSHRFGRKRLILSTITGFTISSVLCGLAPTLPLLVLFRVLQGLTGGGLQPLSQSVLYDEFPKEKWQTAMSFWAMGVILAPTLGPTLGGWITETWSWHWIFYLNVPFGILSWRMVSRFVDDPSHMGDGKAAKFDGIGIAFLALGMAAMQIVLDQGEQKDWFQSTPICWLTAIAIVFTILLIVRELRAPNPFLKVGLFKDFTFAMGSIAGFLMYAVLFGSIILVPLFMEEVLGWDAMTTGWNMGARGIGSFSAIILQWIPGFDKLKKSRWTVILGFSVAGIIFVYGYGRMNASTHGWDIFWPQAVQGLFTTLAFMPLVTVATSNIEDKDRTYATSLYGMVRNLGSSVGVSFVAIFLDKRAQIHQAALAAQGFPSNPALVRMTGGLKNYFMLQGADGHLAAYRAYVMAYRELLIQANMLSFIDAFTFFGWMIIAVAVGLCFAKLKHV